VSEHWPRSWCLSGVPSLSVKMLFSLRHLFREGEVLEVHSLWSGEAGNSWELDLRILAANLDNFELREFSMVRVEMF